MRWSDWRRLAAIVVLLSCFLGCAEPSSSQSPPLTAAAARHTLDSWNQYFCKVAEFYGLYKSEENSANQVAYVLIVNPSDKAQRPLVYTARFQLLAHRRDDLPYRTGDFRLHFVNCHVRRSFGVIRGFDPALRQPIPCERHPPGIRPM